MQTSLKRTHAKHILFSLAICAALLAAASMIPSVTNVFSNSTSQAQNNCDSQLAAMEAAKEALAADRNNQTKRSAFDAAVATWNQCRGAQSAAAKSAGKAAPNATGGPDGFGNTWRDNQGANPVPYQFVDISGTGTNLGTGDDEGFPYTLQAPFSFYGSALTTVAVTTNGYISTDQTDDGPDLSNDCPLPVTPSTGGGARIYPLHDDLVVNGGVYAQYFATCPRPNDFGGCAEACTVFQWQDVDHFGSDGQNFDFQAILYHTRNEIVYQIGPGNPEAGSGSTTGIQNAAASVGLTIACNTANTVPSGYAVAIFAPGAAPCSDPVGPGIPVPATSEMSDQKAGSVLIYNVYTSGATSGNAQNTRINITNVHPQRDAWVHLFFVAESCAIADSYICLTANQTASFLASDLDPGTTGYIVAVAVDGRIGCPVNFNYLIGDEYVKFASGHAANLGAEAFAAGSASPCDGNSVTATLAFDGQNYNRLPAVLALDNVGSRADGNDTLVVINRIAGNLGIGASSLGTLFGILYDDAENALSFSVAGGCQLRNSITNNFPRTTPRFETFIPAGRTGWAKVFNQTGAIGITGAAINFNANAASSAGAFNQGHNLHALTLNATNGYVIPVFPPSC